LRSIRWLSAVLDPVAFTLPAQADTRGADREAEKLRGALQDLEDKRQRLMDLALDGPFGKDDMARLAASLDAERAAVERELWTGSAGVP
jgi:hypothetical protein